VGIILVSFIIFLFFGLPIAFAMGFPSLIYIIVYNPDWLRVVPSNLFSGMNSFVFLAIPFFVMAGEMMNEAKITDGIIEFTDSLLGHVRGGMAHVLVVSEMFLSGVSGSAIADIAALGSFFLPAMDKSGYTKRFSAAIMGIASLQGPIIPPSLIMIIYASVVGVNVGALLIAGIVPGVLFALCDCIIIALQAKKKNLPKRGTPFSLKIVFKTFWKGIPALILPIIILGGIIGGVVTPTEAGAIAVFYGLALSIFLYRSLKYGAFIRILRSTAMKTGTLFIIVAFAKIFSWVLAMENVPALVGKYVFGWTNDVYLLLFILNLILLFVGTWLETAAAIILLAPVFVPPLVGMGLHPVHLGLVIVVNLTIGLITPPFGVALFAVSSLSGLSIEEIAKEALPYMIANIGVLLILTYVPSISLFVPRWFGLI
jgi:tripartite ATP-independent transporter DctM subunit